MSEANGKLGNGGSRPVPDPTLLTTQQLHEAIAAVREILEKEIAGNRNVFEARLSGMDEAIRLLQTFLDRRDPIIDARIEHLKDLVFSHLETLTERFQTIDVRFEGVRGQFDERDVRVKEAQIATATAVAAALQAAKEAVGEQAKNFQLSVDKSETATTKQIDALLLSFQTAIRGVEIASGDVKERLTRLESTGVAVKEVQHDNRAQSNWMIGAIFGAIGTLVGLAGFIIAITK